MLSPGSCHVPVMLQEVLDSLPANPKIVVDGTLGHGGHTINILQRFPTIQKLYGFDLDPNIFCSTKEKLAGFSDKIEFVNKSYIEIPQILGDQKVDFLLVDLGVNMEHFKDGSRGFSINIDSRLDMRFDNSCGQSAYDIINGYEIAQLQSIFVNYADFSPAKSKEIAKKIADTRKITKIESTFELKNLLNQLGLGQKASTVIFQAIRIETNNEITNIKELLGKIPDILSIGGRCGIITFHSIEDRLVKQYFKSLVSAGGFALVSKKAIKPSYTEIQQNRASRSAKYRLIQKII